LCAQKLRPTLDLSLDLGLHDLDYALELLATLLTRSVDEVFKCGDQNLHKFLYLLFFARFLVGFLARFFTTFFLARFFWFVDLWVV
jgi:hypothetical protein